MATILSPDISPEEQARQNAEREAADRAAEVVDILLPIILRGYRAGKMKLETFCYKAAGIVNVPAVPDYIRRMKMGAYVLAAVKEGQAHRDQNSARKNLDELDQLYLTLVNRAAELDGFRLSREVKGQPQTAYGKIAEVLYSHGLKETPASVEKACIRARKANTP